MLVYVDTSVFGGVFDEVRRMKLEERSAKGEGGGVGGGGFGAGVGGIEGCAGGGSGQLRA